MRKKTSPSTCISVLNWNGWQHTLACLDSLLPLLIQTPATLVICDNASDDDSWAQLNAWAAARRPAADISRMDQQNHDPPPPVKPVVLLRTPRNRGFSAGHNAVLNLFQNDFVYFWLLNNDLTVDPPALQALLDCAAARPEVGVFGSTVLEADNPEVLQCAGGCRYYPWLTVFKNVGQGLAVDEVPLSPRLDYVYGAAMFIRARCFAQAGLLNEDYFLFYEELDFARRIEPFGYELAWCRASRVWHQGSASVGTAAAGDKARLIRANYYENLSTLKYTARFHPHLLWPVAGLRLVLKALAVSMRRAFFLLRPLWRAYRDFW